MNDDIIVLDREIEDNREIGNNSHYSNYYRIGESYIRPRKRNQAKRADSILPLSVKGHFKPYNQEATFYKSFVKSISIFFQELNTTKPSPLEKLIKDSKYIYSLKEGWDGEVAEIIPIEIWETATAFLRNYYGFIKNKLNTSIPLPDISPVRDGSIDLEWHTGKGRFLINFSNKRPTTAAYYGDRYNNLDSTKGTIDITHIKPFLASWMAESL